MKKQRRYDFPKQEKLKKSGIIKKIFERGQILKSYPFNCLYTVGNEKKIAVIVPKKNKVKLATDRNLLKRRIREAYRLNKHLLHRNLMIIFIYKTQNIESFDKINIAMINSLLSLSEIY